MFPDDLGDPICLYYVAASASEDNSTEPFTLDRPWLEQTNQTTYIDNSCEPVPYADGTPHFFGVIWQQATGRPLEFCEGYRAADYGLKRPACRQFSSSSAQKEALRAAFENLDVSRGRHDRAKNFFVTMRFGFSVRFVKCPTTLVVLTSVLPVVLAVLGGSLLIVVVVKVITRSNEGIFHIPSPVGNYQEILRLERQQRHFAKRVEELEEELREVKNRHTNDRPGAEENATGGQPVSSAPGAAPAGGQEHSRTSYGSIGEAGGAAIRESAAESVAPPPLETPVRRRRASTDISD